MQVAAWDVPTNNQAAIVLADIFGDAVSDELLPVDRLTALSIPAVAAAHATLVSAFGNLQLQDIKGSVIAAEQPAWMTQTGRGTQPWYLRNSRTMADFLFIGISLWQCTRDSTGYPSQAWHVPFGRWSFDDNGVILIDEKSVAEDSIIFFESAMPGLLNTATRTLRQALNFEHTIAERARYSVPITTLTPPDGVSLDNEETKGFLELYKEAVSRRDGSIAVIQPNGWTKEVQGEPQGTWLLDARNAVAADIAKHSGIPASRLGSTSSIDSLTYTTELGQFTDLMTQTAHFYLDPITARLSMGDVTPNGHTVAFDLTPLDKALQPLASTPAPTQEVPTAQQKEVPANA